jgi:hypothetical protein
MATTTTRMNTELSRSKHVQTDDTATPTLETRRLARFLHSAIHYHLKTEFFATLAQGADINFTGLHDQNREIDTPLITAIVFDNRLAFDALLERGVDVHKPGRKGFTPLDKAIVQGNVSMVQTLLSYGARPLFIQGTCLSILLEIITTRTLLEPLEPRIRWRYENESPDTHNTPLKQQILDFYLQQGAYTPAKVSQVIPFVQPEHAIHVHFQGKTEILGELLSRNVSPILPVPTTTRSPWAIVQNPTKYFTHFRSDRKEKLEYVETDPENPNILIFTMTLVNKRNTGTLPMKIFVHYNFEPSKKLIEAVVAHLNPHMLAVTESLSQGMQETGNKLNQQLIAVQRKLSDAQRETAQEMKNVKDVVHYDARQEIDRFVTLIKNHPNAQEAYQRFKIGLEAIHTSALAVKGGGVTVSEGPLTLVASVLDMSTELVDMIPLVGSAASKLFGLASKVATATDSVRQKNLFENIAAMATGKEARKIFESVARKLTMAYLLQFERLATKETAQAQMSRTQQSLQNAKGKVLNSRFKSPAEQVTAFAILWMMEEVFNNAHTDTLAKEIAEKGLEAVLLNAVTQRRPAETLTSFWNELTSKLGINAIPTQSASGTISGETWHPADFWTAPGVVVENASGSQYFTGNNTNVEKFGYRVGSLADIRALGLTPTTEVSVLPEPSAPAMPSVATTTMPSANNRLNTATPTPVVAYAYLNVPTEPLSANTTCNSVPSVPPSPCGTTQDNPPAPKRAKSPSPLQRLRNAIKT